MSLFSRLLKPKIPPLHELWLRIVEIARDPCWYLDYDVPDTVDGRFDMVALVTSLVMLRMERDELIEETARLTERFVDDMDGSLRTIGIGDMVIGKHMGRMMGGLGGRMGSYREALDAASNKMLEEALSRNVFRGEAAHPSIGGFAAAVRSLAERIDTVAEDALLAGEIR